METAIINRVANSSLLTIDLEDWYDHRERKVFDLAEYLFKGLVLKELEFRVAMKAHDWTQYQNCRLSVFCSVDAIVPTWAFMLVANRASEFAESVHFCNPEDMDQVLYEKVISELDLNPFKNQKVIIKGCSQFPVPVSAYVALTAALTPVVQSLMYGEACSNVPIFKRKPTLATSASTKA